MTKLDRSKTIRFLVFVLLVTGAASCSQKNSSVSAPTAPPAPSIPAKTSAALREQIAKTYGLDGFGQVEAIKYTFNAQFPGVNVSRSWIWETKKDQVSYEGKDKDGWPHFKQLKPLPGFIMIEQENFLKDHILLYFQNQNIQPGVLHEYNY